MSPAAKLNSKAREMDGRMGTFLQRDNVGAAALVRSKASGN